MANCTNCGNKIGLFQAKHRHIDDQGTSVRLCHSCYKKQIEYENQERVSQIVPFLERYYSNCDELKRVAIGRLYSDNDLFILFDDYDLENAKIYFEERISSFREMAIDASADELDSIIQMINIYGITKVFLADLEKMYKIVRKKGIYTSYPELIILFHGLLENQIDQKNLQVVTPEYVRISNLLKDDITVQKVIKELIKSPTKNKVDPEICSLLLKKFHLDFQEDFLQILINELVEEVELDDFEEKMGGSKKQISLPDYELMDGYEFEAFLKDVFESLGYTVVQTKLSGDQGADLIIIKENVKTVVQAKKYAGKVSNKAVQEVVASKMHYGCEKAMVVATGEFTKSANQLALSNKVELWDKIKLNQKIQEIENIPSSTLSSEQIIPIIFDELSFSCPFCHTPIKIQNNDLPGKNTPVKMPCPGCNLPLSFDIPESFFCCNFCKSKFDTVKDCNDHAKNCKEKPYRLFTCIHCKKEFVLDDIETQTLKNNGSVEVGCPKCNKFNAISLVK